MYLDGTKPVWLYVWIMEGKYFLHLSAKHLARLSSVRGLQFFKYSGFFCAFGIKDIIPCFWLIDRVPVLSERLYDYNIRPFKSGQNFL